MNGITWKNFEQERHMVTSWASRAAATSTSSAPMTAACTRCVDSTTSPRVTITSSEVVESGGPKATGDVGSEESKAMECISFET